MISLAFAYTLAGLIFAAFAIAGLADRRPANAAFHALLSVSFLAGDRLGDLGNGALVLALVALAGTGALRRSTPPTTAPDERRAQAARRGNRLFLPALIVPATALLGTLVLKSSGLVDPKQVTLISLALGVVVALAATMLWLRPPLGAPVQEGRRLIDAVGWACVLPQMLASLGAVFALAGVGGLVGQGVGAAIPDGSRLAAVVAYTGGMALFTMVMGNAYAAFPVMTAAIGLPLLVRGFGGDPAVVCALGMLSGFCGTLLTPMAANFNVVPATLLDLDDRNGVIKAQVATALPMLAINTALLYGLAF